MERVEDRTIKLSAAGLRPLLVSLLLDGRIVQKLDKRGLGISMALETTPMRAMLSRF
jgi:hypothetical protein